MSGQQVSNRGTMASVRSGCRTGQRLLLWRALALAVVSLLPEVSAQDARPIASLIGDLVPGDVARRNAAIEALIAHPDRAAVVAALADTLIAPHADDSEWHTAVGIGGGDEGKQVRALAEPDHVARATRCDVPTCFLRDDLDLAFTGWGQPVLAAWILGRVGKDAGAAIQELAAATRGDDRNVADMARWALTQLDGKHFDDLLDADLADWDRGRILAVVGRNALSEDRLLALIGARDRRPSELGATLASHWRMTEPAVLAALAARASAGDAPHALAALLALGIPALPHLLALARHTDAAIAQIATAAAQQVVAARPLSGPALPPDTATAFAAVASSADIDTAHFALTALASLQPEASLRGELRANVSAWCKHPDGRRRLLGFRHLGSFGAEASDEDLVQRGLEDEFENVAWEAAVAGSRRSAPPSQRMLRRLCKAADAGDPRAVDWFRRRMHADAPATATELEEHGKELEGEGFEILLAAAKRDDRRVLQLVSDYAHEFAAAALRAPGPITETRFRAIAAACGSDPARLSVALALSADVPEDIALPVILRAVDLGTKRDHPKASERLVPSETHSAKAKLLEDALEQLGRLSKDHIAAHRAVLERTLQDPIRSIRERAADLLRKLR